MRTIDADALIADLEHDVELDARALDCLDNESRRDIIQFDKDCKQNAIDLLRKAPTAQLAEYEPVAAENFAKTMSENSPYNFVAWHQEALTLMKKQGFVICKKT